MVGLLLLAPNKKALLCKVLHGTWGERWGSNPRHSGPQPDALPTELRPPDLSALTVASFYYLIYP